MLPRLRSMGRVLHTVTQGETDGRGELSTDERGLSPNTCIL